MPTEVGIDLVREVMRETRGFPAAASMWVEDSRAIT